MAAGGAAQGWCLKFALAIMMLAVLVSGGTFSQDANEGPGALWTQATLYRDEWGVPHVYADNARALGYAFGYAQSQDHLEDLLMAFRIAKGRAAEVLGEDYAASDAFAIRVGNARLAEQALPTLDPITVDLCEGFALGINAWIYEHPKDVPEWADGATPADPLALWHAYVLSLAPIDSPNIPHPTLAAGTGNAWAVAPGRMVEGKSVLVISPHAYYDGPFQWYEAHLVCGDMDVAGATLFGLPIILQGHNTTLGWALTPNAPDFADLSEEHLPTPSADAANNPAGVSAVAQERQVLLLQYLSQMQPYYVRTATGLEERAVPVLSTSLGPVLEDNKGGLFSWKVGGYGEFGAFRQLIDMARASDLPAFQQALSYHQFPCFHVICATQSGHLFYLYGAKTGAHEVVSVSENKDQQGLVTPDWKSPVDPGLLGRAWASVPPLQFFPRVEDPESGYVQACGNPPWFAAQDIAQNSGDIPAWFVQDTDTFRSARVRQVLSSGRLNFPDVRSLLFDAYVPAAAELVPKLLEYTNAQPNLLKTSHPDLGTGLGLLRDWDYVARPHAPAMTFFNAWWNLLSERMPAFARTQVDFFAALHSNDPQAQAALLGSAEDAARMLRNEFPDFSPEWGQLHRLVRGDRSEAVPGSLSGGSVMAMGADAFVNHQWPVRYGPGFAMAIQFGDTPVAYSVSPFGASNRPGNAHYADQMGWMLNGRMKRAYYLEDDVCRYAQSAQGRRVVLFPRGVDGEIRLDAEQIIEARCVVAADPATPFPDALVPFSPCITAEYGPQGVNVLFHVAIYVPEILCLKENLRQLSLYTQESGLAWQQETETALDPEERIFSLDMDHVVSVALLGPSTCLLKTPSQVPMIGHDASQTAPEGEAPVPVPVVSPEGEAPATPSEPAPPTMAAPSPEGEQPSLAEGESKPVVQQSPAPVAPEKHKPFLPRPRRQLGR